MADETVTSQQFFQELPLKERIDRLNHCIARHDRKREELIRLIPTLIWREHTYDTRYAYKRIPNSQYVEAWFRRCVNDQLKLKASRRQLVNELETVKEQLAAMQRKHAASL